MPVSHASWDDAQLYVEWLSRMTHKPYRLLTEAEWEYAARAGTATAYYWGDEIGEGHANGGKLISDISPVGAYPANPFGLYDMAGNVEQWVEDCWHHDYNGAPADGSGWTSGDCSYRVSRGGDWQAYGWAMRSAARSMISAGARSLIGFRVGRTLAPLRNDSQSAAAYYDRGNAYFRRQDYDRAIAHYDVAISLNPNYVDAHIGRGNAYLRTHDYDRAIANFNEAIRLDPNYAAYYGRGNAYLGMQDYDRAIANFDEAISRNSEHDLGAYNGRGNAYLGKRDYDRAIANFDEAISGNSEMLIPTTVAARPIF